MQSPRLALSREYFLDRKLTLHSLFGNFFLERWRQEREGSRNNERGWKGFQELEKERKQEH